MKSLLRPLDALTLWKLSRVGALALSPDGARAVCSVTRHDIDKNSASTSLWLLSTLGGEPRQLTRCGDKDGQASWSPAGDQIAFVARRENDGQLDSSAQLYLMSPDGGEARRVSNFAPGVQAYRWMPDGKRLLFSAWVWPHLKGAAAQNRQHKAWTGRKETGYATSEAFYRYWDHNIPQDRVLHLLLLDISSGRVTDLFEGTTYELDRAAEGNSSFAVHPGGGRLAFAHDPAPVQRLGNRSAITELTLRGRRFVALRDQVGWDFCAPSYSPNGRLLAFTAAHVGKVHTAFNQPAVQDLGTGQWRVLSKTWDGAVGSALQWSTDGQALYFTADERGRTPLWRCDVAGGAVTAVYSQGSVQGFDVGADLTVLAADSALHPARVLSLRAQAQPMRLERFNDEVLAGVQLGVVQEVTFRGALGQDVQMWLTFPPNFDARRKHAVTHVIHGGPFAAAGDTFGWRWNPHVFAAAGQVIAQVNFHGSSGFGWAFRHSLIGRQGELELQDIEAGTDWLLRQPWADPARVCATGGSYGGFLVAWMNGHVPVGRYQAYICHAGVFDRVSTFSADSYPVRPKDLAANFWEDMDRVLAQSPHASASKMNTPTLVIHGAQDYRVPDGNGLAYYNTLKARGVDARLLWFPDENHWVLKPRNSVLWYREFAAWLAQYTRPKRGASQVKRPKG